MTCLENGNKHCNNGTISLIGIMEKMKFAYHSATSKDVLKLQQKLLEANFTYKLSPIATGENEVTVGKQIIINMICWLMLRSYLFSTII